MPFIAIDSSYPSSSSTKPSKDTRIDVTMPMISTSHSTDLFPASESTSASQYYKHPASVQPSTLGKLAINSFIRLPEFIVELKLIEFNAVTQIA